MTTLAKPRPSVTLELRRFTVAEYYAMAEAGILTEDDRIELIDGVIIKMPPIGSRHVGAVNRFTRELSERAGRRAVVQVQSPVRLDNATEPLPDLALLRERADLYSDNVAGPAEALLLIEVADTAADYDRYEKLPRYARAGIPEVWLTILPARIIEVYTEPVDGRYAVQRILSAGDTLRLGCFPDIALPVSAILPGS